MNTYPSKPQPENRGITLNDLKDQLYSLNMQLLFAIQYHNEKTQKDVLAKIAKVQADMDDMFLGVRPRL